MVATSYQDASSALRDSPQQSQSDAAALARLLAEVAATGYTFTTPTPLTHQRYLERCAHATATSLRDVFGWNMPFATAMLPPSMLRHMQDAGVLERVSGSTLRRSAVRMATLGGDIFLHSGFPTEAAASVFFGPDTYRFARFLQHALADLPQPQHASPLPTAQRVLDIGCGSGAGGIVAARLLREHGYGSCITMSDINPIALRLTAANAEAAGIAVALAHGDGVSAVSAVQGEFDLIISNPPYLFDEAQRTYRHGGEGLGRALSVRFVREALPRLAIGGRLLLYTGVAMVDGVDPFLAEIMSCITRAGYRWHYAEIDPDVFSEELARPMYQHVERIAAVGLTVWRDGCVK